MAMAAILAMLVTCVAMISLPMILGAVFESGDGNGVKDNPSLSANSGGSLGITKSDSANQKVWRAGEGASPGSGTSTGSFTPATGSGGGRAGAAAGGLSEGFYGSSCPQVETIIEQQLRVILQADIGQAAGILRIMFHDCFVQGCDASLLLVRPTTEQTATPNNASIRASSLRALDTIKAAIEAVCPGVVSCADTIVLSTKIAVKLSGGPIIPMRTGRRDGLSAASNQTVVNNIPPPTLNITALKQNFQNQGLDSRDLVALSGGHTIGRAHCRFVDPQITPTISTDLNTAFALNLSRICLPANNSIKARQTTHLDFITQNLFDNSYFQNVLSKVAIFHTDAALTNASDTLQLVQLYAQNQPLFFQQFSQSMIKMSQLNILTGQQGEIRKKCTTPNQYLNA
ncbi:hypothetical protein KP509_38G021800 [Ceratopteris richardii]|uniref:Peroxidase n=1 Tax=Ceratopteris richardii TaxID=49495 RepID=A0A8T2Q3Q5_CERRI|nr:hypothetical protein KP509_38G021800 [Ceratopteris richardii]